MSLRASTSRPSICSGAMYGVVPSSVPRCRCPSPIVVSAERAVRLLQLREAEVEQLHAGLRQHDVVGLEIAMDDPVLRGVERGGISIAYLIAARAGAPLDRSASVWPSRHGMTRK